MKASKQDAINIFVETIDWEKIIVRWGLPKGTPNYFETEEFQQYWRQNSMLRPGQALINLGLIKDGFFQWEDTYLFLLSSCHK